MTEKEIDILMRCFMDVMTKEYGLVDGTGKEVVAQLKAMNITVGDNTDTEPDPARQGLHVVQEVEGKRVLLFFIGRPQEEDGTMVVRYGVPVKE